MLNVRGLRSPAVLLSIAQVIKFHDEIKIRMQNHGLE